MFYWCFAFWHEHRACVLAIIAQRRNSISLSETLKPSDETHFVSPSSTTRQLGHQ